MVERVLRSGSCVLSSTMEDVPGRLSLGHSALQFPLGSKWYTELDHDGQVALHLGRSLCVLLPALVLHM